MQNLKGWLRLVPNASSRPTILNNVHKALYLQNCAPVTNAGLHTSSSLSAYLPNRNDTNKWPQYNEKMYPPQAPDEERRPAYVCHMRTNIKYSPWKMWYVANMVRGMTVDEAVKQMSFVNKKGAQAVKEVILEAQKLAVEKHHVEFKSNLWVAESFVGKGVVIKGMRRHARARMGKVEYFHCHYFVRLEEGTPPKDYYYYRRQLSGPELLEKWLKEMRDRKISNTL